MTNLRKGLLLLMLFVSVSVGGVSAENTLPATNDIYTDSANRSTNTNGDRLIVAYTNLLDTFRATTVAFIQSARSFVKFVILHIGAIMYAAWS